MGRIQTTQATSKKWKLVQALGAAGFVAGCALILLSIQLREPGRDMPPMGVWGGVLFFLAPPLYLLGRMGAWWFHG